MSLYDKIKKEIVYCRKCGDYKTRLILQYVISEVNRLKGVHKDVNDNYISDDVVLKVCKDIIKKENKLLDMGKGDHNTIEVLKRYMPKTMDKQKIKKYIINNINFEELKNKMAIIGIMKKEFGEVVDSNDIKEVIMESFYEKS